jgi:hypothetical protein
MRAIKSALQMALRGFQERDDRNQPLFIRPSQRTRTSKRGAATRAASKPAVRVIRVWTRWVCISRGRRIVVRTAGGRTGYRAHRDTGGDTAPTCSAIIAAPIAATADGDIAVETGVPITGVDVRPVAPGHTGPGTSPAAATAAGVTAAATSGIAAAATAAIAAAATAAGEPAATTAPTAATKPATSAAATAAAATAATSAHEHQGRI